MPPATLTTPSVKIKTSYCRKFGNIKEVFMELQLTPRKETRLNSKERHGYWEKGLVPAAVYGRSIDAGVCFFNSKHSRHRHPGRMVDVNRTGQPCNAAI
ncbi:MAG: hypothetical protein VXV96_02805, partial [Bdellovibrionota bacterium]|nr:hypothetical protein [Bdellovibrionota bacterium]